MSMKNFRAIQVIFFIMILSSPLVAAQITNSSTETRRNPEPSVSVIELRNYLLRPNAYDRFRALFNDKFVQPMYALGGFTVGQYQIQNEPDHFVWIRGFENMKTRVDFLNAFYYRDPIWRQYRAEANSMIVNNDNVYLLRPLTESGAIEAETLRKGQIVVVDFFVCNSTRDKVIDLFRKDYLTFLKRTGISDVSLWVSEMVENDFPALPVFQDKNLLVMMTRYNSESDYRQKSNRMRTLPIKLENSMQELITTRSKWILRLAAERRAGRSL